MPTSDKAEDADADGPTLREQMLEASAGALKKKKAARAKVQKKRFVYVFCFYFRDPCATYSFILFELQSTNKHSRTPQR